ncbi:MAG: hypothetical protein U5K51_00720 [Flavobacteriaceae bacterium]|nr:hypothetical protein [Flavobacteriaceae bacterium]
MKKLVVLSFLFFMTILCFQEVYGQAWKSDSTWTEAKKNVIRYNLSQPMLVGFDNAIIFGYERLLKPNQSISVNIGRMSLPKLGSVITEDFELLNDVSNKGYNFSVDYRFYLGKLNKYSAPRGVYIGPYYSINSWGRENEWSYFSAVSDEEREVTVDSKLNINMVGFELGYQFVFWDRMTLDLVLIGPGVGWYKLNAKAEGNLTQEEKEKVQDIVLDLIQEKFPGLDYTLDDDELDADGTLRQTTIGFRYLIHIGYNF